jgi:hypothetical protein
VSFFNLSYFVVVVEDSMADGLSAKLSLWWSSNKDKRCWDQEASMPQNSPIHKFERTQLCCMKMIK